MNSVESVNNSEWDYWVDYYEAILEEDEESSRTFTILTCLFFGILTLIGLGGNIIVIFVTITTKRIIKHPVHSIIVLNLAVADIIYVLASAPYQALWHNLSVIAWRSTPGLCKFWHFVNLQTITVSIFTMCSLAIMRFLALMVPFHVNRSCISPTKKSGAAVIIPLVWILGSLLSLPNAINYQIYEHTFPNESETVYECEWKSSYGKDIYQISVTVITFLLPLFLLVFLHYFIRKEITKQQLNDGVERREETRITIMILFLVLAFLICWFPYNLHVVLKISDLRIHPDTMINLDVAARVFSYAHACVNPVIYTFGAPGFRKSSYRMFTSLRCNTLYFLLCRDGKKHLAQLGKSKSASESIEMQTRSCRISSLARNSNSASRKTLDTTSAETRLLMSDKHADVNIDVARLIQN